MKEAIEKLKERLEKKISNAMHNFTLFTDTGHERLASVCEVTANAYTDALSIVSEVEAEYGNGWIPCSERLPDEPKENPFFEGKPLELYLVSMKHGEYPFSAFWNGKDFTDGWSVVHPEAWMPLPEPYNPEKGAQDGNGD